MAKLIIGCGYLGRRVANRWLRAGHEVRVVTRSESKAAEFREAGYVPIVADITQPAALQRLPDEANLETVLFAVGWDRHAGQTIEQVYAEGLANVLAVLPREVGKFIYISSTGVYGQVAGDWVDETTPCLPLREGGRACLAAERLLQASPFADRAIILRLAGIYGPNRIPRAQDLQAGLPIAAPSAGYLNLIHVDDAANIVLLAEEKAPAANLYVVSDGAPVLRSEYYAELARLLNAPPPQFVDPPSNTPAAQRAASDKRVSNRRLLAELQPHLLYPSYREGLTAIVKG
jgi:nucleoside-diphosphate-sugar epimerase